MTRPTSSPAKTSPSTSSFQRCVSRSSRTADLAGAVVAHDTLDGDGVRGVEGDGAALLLFATKVPAMAATTGAAATYADAQECRHLTYAPVPAQEHSRS